MSLLLQTAHHLPLKPKHLPRAAQRSQRHLAPLPRLKPHRRARRNVEPEPARPFPVKAQRIVGLEEMIVRTDLYGPVPVLATSSVTRAPPLFSSMSPLCVMISPGIMFGLNGWGDGR